MLRLLDAPSQGSARINNFDDSQSELTVAEFAHLLLRVSQARQPSKMRRGHVAQSFTLMMEESVLPHAKRDTLAFLRDAMDIDKRLRHVLFMHRRKLGAVFRKYCGPTKGDRHDRTSRDKMSLQSFTRHPRGARTAPLPSDATTRGAHTRHSDGVRARCRQA